MKPAQLSALLTVAALTASASVLDREMIRAERDTGQHQTYRTALDVVRVDVLASQNGRPLTGLTPGDFEVFDNGVLQHVQVATTANGVRILLLLDVSSSLGWGAKMQALTRASQSVVERLEGEDEASLMTFSDRLSLLASSVRDRVAVERQMLAISPKSGERTALWDAVFVGLSFAAREPGPSVVLLFTDGIDTASWCDAQRIREVIKHTEAVVYAVTVPPIPATGPGVVRADTEEERERLQTIDRARESFVPKDLKEVVEQSGGELFLAGRGEELADRFVTVLREYRARYLLTYEPTGVGRDDGWHQLRVRLKGRAGMTRARAGYYARPRGAGPP